MKIELPRLHPNQQIVLDNQQRFNVLSCGRRWGKTTLGMDRVVNGMLLGKRVCWASPTYKMLDEIWRGLLLTLNQVLTKVSQQQHYMTIKTGGSLDMWSLDNANALRGRNYDLVIIDEAAMVSDLEDSWNAVLRPTLADTRGNAWFLSTPKGRNYFWDLYLRGQDERYDDWASWQMPTNSNPYISNDEVLDLRRSLPDMVARQEIDAEPILDGGAVFRNVEACIYTEPHIPTVKSTYAFGVDVGRTHDFTVITVLDLSDNTVVEIDRFTGIGFKLQEFRIKALADKYDPDLIIVELNNFGHPMVEDLMDMGLPIRAFKTSYQSKKFIIENLAMAFEYEQIRIPIHPELVNELRAFEVSTLPSGGLKYGANQGGLDDCVMSLAFAFFAANKEAREVRSDN